MTLAAEQVVEAVRARIGLMAFTDHPQPFDESELPAFRVTYDPEETDGVSLDGKIVQHILPVRVTALARDVDDVVGVLNAIAAVTLPLIFAPPVPYGLQMSGVVERAAPGEGETATGALEIPLRAMFFTQAAAPETIIS